MNAARPLAPETYKKLLAEMYTDGKTTYQVELDADPAANPKLINAKLSQVQAYKNRVVNILNQAVANEAYWNSAKKKLEARFEYATNAAMLTEEVKAHKNGESREAAAAIAAGKKIVDTLFQGAGEYTDHLCTLLSNLADAQSFLGEVEHVFKNLDSTDMNLAVQQKNVLLCVRLSGDQSAGARREQSLEDREEVRATEVTIS